MEFILIVNKVVKESKQMRKRKIFKQPNSYDKMTEWAEKNKDKFQMDIIFIENGYVIEYKPLKKIIFK